jgi:hypothetical protein
MEQDHGQQNQSADQQDGLVLSEYRLRKCGPGKRDDPSRRSAARERPLLCSREKVT